jgi:polar amino acid transport system substrate-binding protein
MPWTDGYRLAREEGNVILFSTTRSPAREKLFKWVGPLVPNDSALFARKDSGIVIKTIDDARKVKRIGVYKDDFGELLLKGKGFTNLDAVLENRMNVPRLLNGDIELWIANELTGRFMIAQAGAGDKIEKVLAMQKDDMYIAFSRNTPDEVIARWQRVLDEFKADGTYGQIFVQWMNRLYR